MELSQKIKDLRKKKGLSQLELAEELVVSRQAVSGWEAGTSRPSTENLQNLSRLFNIPLETLLDDTAKAEPAAAPEKLPAEEREKEEDKGQGWGQKQEVQKKGRQRVRWLVIGTVVFVLLICFLSWHRNNQKDDMDDLHTIQREDTTLGEVPKFDLNWD